jgi:hypothetical protein
MSGKPTAELRAVADVDARKEPIRLVVLQAEERPAVHAADEDWVMTFPHLMLRELIAFLCLSLGLVAMSLLFDAPLEELANPEKTPNPAKAPWYFLGLQELLHYYPPVVSGVILPGLVVLSLAIIPYFDINLERRAFWPAGEAAAVRTRRAGILAAVIAALTAIFLFTGAHPVWPVIVPLWLVGLAALLPWAAPATEGILGWLATRSLAFLVFGWFLLSAVALTTIGTFFRGPGWSFVLPWGGAGGGH